jgi:hypothetical protein
VLIDAYKNGQGPKNKRPKKRAQLAQFIYTTDEAYQGKYFAHVW